MAPGSYGVVEKLIELSRLLVEDDGLDATLGRVATVSTSLIGACDSCGVSLVSDGVVSTRAASDARADRVDELQYSQGVGPCLEAIRTGDAVRVSSFEDETRWPGFIERALLEGVRASYSVPLRVDDALVGSLNLYSCGTEFSPSDQAVGNLLATQAAVALRNAQTFHDVLDMVDQLEDALSSRDLIGQAKGMLMAQMGLDSDQAFDELRRMSQERNIKLRDLAQHVVDGTVGIDAPD